MNIYLCSNVIVHGAHGRVISVSWANRGTSWTEPKNHLCEPLSQTQGHSPAALPYCFSASTEIRQIFPSLPRKWRKMAAFFAHVITHLKLKTAIKSFIYFSIFQKPKSLNLCS